MKLGAEPKKVAALAGLLVLAAYSIYTNVLSGPDLPPDARQTVPSKQVQPEVDVPQAPAPPPSSPRNRPRYGRAGVGEFRPTLRPARAEDRPDPMKVDPTLKLDLLAKLQNVTIEGGMRSLFEFGSAPPPPQEQVKIPIKDTAKTTARSTEVKPPAPVTPKDPPPTPIPLKFYGFSSPRGSQDRRAFFLQGEDIFIAAEGELVQKRYKIVKIGLTSATVEDTQQKNYQQTLALEEQPITG